MKATLAAFCLKNQEEIEMKKRMVFAALMAVLIMLPAAAVQAQNTPVYSVILTNQNPYPAEPGNTATPGPKKLRGYAPD